MCETSVIEWFKRFINKPEFNEESLEPLLHFSLLWNLFENNYFNDENQLNIVRLFELSDLAENSVSDECINNVFDYFKQRYFQDNQTTNVFETLGLRRTRTEEESDYEFCKTVFLGSSPEKIKKLQVVFLVVHRFRNNFFHGRKDQQILDSYEQPFRQINKFLMRFITATVQNDSVNNQRFNN